MRLIWLVMALLVLGMASLCLGRSMVGPAGLFEVLTRGAEAKHGFVVLTLRLPRLMVAAGAGAGLGLSGALCQSLLRNPLAAPDLIGVTAGASLGAVAVLLGPGAAAALPAGATAAGAAAGALLAGALVLALSRGTGTATLILGGIGVSLVASALTQALLIEAGDQIAGDAMLWLVGTVNGRGWVEARLVWTVMPCLAALAFLTQRTLARLELGDDVAASLGVEVARARHLLLGLAALLAGSAVAAVGPVAFVALMAGPAARAVLRAPGPPLAGATLVGAAILVAADLAARLLSPIALMPAGIFTGALGAPFLIWLLSRQIARDHA